MKRILIIGATSAIATACARRWTAEPAFFFLVGRNKEKLQLLSSDLTARGAHKVSIYELDALDYAMHASMLEHSIEALGQIDIALIAHGTLPNQAVCEQDVDLALREIDSNAISVIAIITRIANRLEEQGCGTLAVLSSVAGDRGRPSNYVYGAAKAAVSSFLEGLRARLYKKRVHVADIRPGFVDTPMTRELNLPAILLATPDQVAQRILQGIERKQDVIYAPRFWAFIMLAIRHIPSWLFKRLDL
ncbi:SDR family oxidoreductase [Pseudomonas fulva]|uniref:SDR family oxidoreductase n=1 Tax=Pseudomonas fulva TaxID=47880 RepID=UPI00201E49FD|nr:SDR family oxidoreductase [Pseudomonas fulva]UQY36098.1 SDR family oxidoreductase [Pseudomonas fulva]